MMLWKTEVNLLTRKKVGGASLVDIRFRIDGTLLPLRSYNCNLHSDIFSIVYNVRYLFRDCSQILLGVDAFAERGVALI